MEDFFPCTQRMVTLERMYNARADEMNFVSKIVSLTPKNEVFVIDLRCKILISVVICEKFMQT